MVTLSVSGVYSFENTVDGKRYIGAATDVSDRRKRHLYRLRLGKHSNREFQAAYNLYGESCFQFSILERCAPKECGAREKYWVGKFKGSLFKTRDAGLTSGSPGSVHTQEVKDKIKQALNGLEKSDEHKSNLWKNRQGWTHSEESKKKISESLQEAARNGNRSGPPEGWKHSEESRAKMSKQRKGVSKSPEHRAKIAAAVRAAKRRKK